MTHKCDILFFECSTVIKEETQQRRGKKHSNIPIPTPPNSSRKLYGHNYAIVLDLGFTDALCFVSLLCCNSFSSLSYNSFAALIVACTRQIIE